MEHTRNYELTIWNAEDRIMREDFNEDNTKTETALANLTAAQNQLAAQIANCGNCRIVGTTYVGTGTSGSSGPCRLSFDAKPLLVLIATVDGQLMVIHRGSTLARNIGSTYTNTVTWSSNTVSWYHTQSNTSQFNSPGITYYVFALFEQE